MIKENAVRQALPWVPQIEKFPSIGAGRSDAANDEPFLPPPPPSLGSRLANFGGRQKRYKVQRHTQLRVYDPFACAYVEFSHERYMLAWLLMRFCPAIDQLNHAPQPVGFMSAGRPTLARPHLTWRIVASNRRVFFWLRQEWSEEQRFRLSTFSQTHAVDVVLAGWDELTSQGQLLNNLQTGRQRMATVHHSGLDTRRVAQDILGHLRAKNGRATRGDVGGTLCRRACEDCHSQVDAALFHFLAVGRLKFDLQAAAFGDDTLLRSA